MKGILIIKYQNDYEEHIIKMMMDNFSNHVGINKDYHIIFTSNDKNITEFEVYYEKDLIHTKFDNIDEFCDNLKKIYNA